MSLTMHACSVRTFSRHLRGLATCLTKAQALYQRRGFRQVSTYGFRVGTWFDEEYIYKRI